MPSLNGSAFPQVPAKRERSGSGREVRTEPAGKRLPPPPAPAPPQSQRRGWRHRRRRGNDAAIRLRDAPNAAWSSAAHRTRAHHVTAPLPPLRCVDTLWLMTPAECIDTASRRPAYSATDAASPAPGAALSAEEEDARRRLDMAFLDRLCQRIWDAPDAAPTTTTIATPTSTSRWSTRVPVTTLTAARLLFHRFTLVESFADIDNDLDVVTACLSIACKATENVVRMRDLVRHAYAIRTQGRVAPDESHDKELYARCRECIAQAERQVLHTLNWDIDVGDSVHRVLLAHWAQLESSARQTETEIASPSPTSSSSPTTAPAATDGGSRLPWSDTDAKRMLQVAFSFLNEAHRTVCCCLFPREELAAAALILAMRLCKLEAADAWAPTWMRAAHLDASTTAAALDRIRAEYYARVRRALRDERRAPAGGEATGTAAVAVYALFPSWLREAAEAEGAEAEIVPARRRTGPPRPPDWANRATGAAAADTPSHSSPSPSEPLPPPPPPPPPIEPAFW